jgi:hypothetical protein
MYVFISIVNLLLYLHSKFCFIPCMISCPNVLQKQLEQLDTELNFAHEVEKLPVSNFSVLEIYCELVWHVYGSLMLRLLGMSRICASTKKLKVVLPKWSMVILHHRYSFFIKT